MINLQFNVKRFQIETTTLHNKFLFIKEGRAIASKVVTTHPEPVALIRSGRGAAAKNTEDQDRRAL